MSSHLAQALARGPSTHEHVGIATHEIHPHAVQKLPSGRQVNFPAHQSKAYHGVTEEVEFSPSTALPSLDGGEVYVDIRIPAGSVSPVVVGANLAFDLTNNDGANQLIFAPSPVMLLADQGIVIYSENGGTELLRLPRESILLDHLLLEKPGDQYVTDQIIGRNGVIAACASDFLIFPILSSIWGAGIPFGCLKGDLVVRIHLRGLTSFDNPLTAAPTLNGLVLHVEHQRLPHDTEMKLYRRVRSSTLDYRFYRPMVYRQTLALTGATRYQIALNSVHGLVLGFRFIVRLAGATGSQAAQLYAAEGPLELLDSSGKSMLGVAGLRGRHSMLHQVRTKMGNAAGVAQEQRGHLAWSFAEDFARSYSHGTIEGVRSFDGTQTIAFTTQAGFPAGSYELIFVYYVAASVRLDGGVTSVQTS